jgi:hypothetical protein
VQNNVHYKTLNIVQFDKSLMATAGRCSRPMARGEKGSPGLRGEKGDKGDRGEPGSLFVSWHIDCVNYRLFHFCG